MSQPHLNNISIHTRCTVLFPMVHPPLLSKAPEQRYQRSRSQKPHGILPPSDPPEKEKKKEKKGIKDVFRMDFSSPVRRDKSATGLSKWRENLILHVQSIKGLICPEDLGFQLGLPTTQLNARFLAICGPSKLPHLIYILPSNITLEVHRMQSTGLKQQEENCHYRTKYSQNLHFPTPEIFLPVAAICAEEITDCCCCISAKQREE